MRTRTSAAGEFVARLVDPGLRLVACGAVEIVFDLREDLALLDAGADVDPQVHESTGNFAREGRPGAGHHVARCGREFRRRVRARLDRGRGRDRDRFHLGDRERKLRPSDPNGHREETERDPRAEAGLAAGPPAARLLPERSMRMRGTSGMFGVSAMGHSTHPRGTAPIVPGTMPPWHLWRICAASSRRSTGWCVSSIGPRRGFCPSGHALRFTDMSMIWPPVPMPSPPRCT
jgi:hypothetical protein